MSNVDRHSLRLSNLSEKQSLLNVVGGLCSAAQINEHAVPGLNETSQVVVPEANCENVLGVVDRTIGLCHSEVTVHEPQNLTPSNHGARGQCFRFLDLNLTKEI